MVGPGFFTYDVFLSFRGEDTRMGFTGNLYNALDQRGIRTFMDDKEIQSGEQITPALHKAIEESRIAIIVLSKNYAFSAFCLDELATILECLVGNDRLVLPVFYDVDPSDVRRQGGSYGEALAMHEARLKDKEKVNKWRTSLHHTANLAGFPFKQGDAYEYEFIGRIIKEVSSKINRAFLHVANYPVGLESRVDNVKSKLEVQLDNVVRIVGICGIGGIGKTTIARAVFNSIAIHFEGLCFLEDVRVNSAKYGLVHLQEILLSEIVGSQTNIGNVNKGMSIIKQRLNRKKVLLVLDDVDKIEQLQAFVGASDWFGLGSRVIITTRDEGILKKHMVKNIYVVEELNDEEALKLLNWNAFKTDEVDPSYMDVSKRVLTYASRLPLALEVIGSNLFGKEKEEWELVLDQYKRIPEKKIQEILEVSFDSLQVVEKKIFLDIACCFRGWKLADVEDILNAHYGLSIRVIIGVLIEKSLIKSNDGIVTLHDLIQYMGKAIVQRESEEPGKRSRLWLYEDVLQVLETNTGTSEIQILILDVPKDEAQLIGREGQDVSWDGEAFKNMKSLKTLIVRNGSFTKVPAHLPDSLKVLKWWRYPSPSFLEDFSLKRLVILELPESCLKPSKPIPIFKDLRVLDFGYNDCMTDIPDVSGIPNLEKLSFKHCRNLTKIHDSVGYLEKLRILDAVGCRMLKTFPDIRLIAIEQLNLSHCSILKSFPNILVKMENITELCITGTPVGKFPFSIRNLTQLRKLELQSCGMVLLPSSIVLLQELCLLSVSECQGLSFYEQDRGEEMVSKSSNVGSLTLSGCNVSDEFLPMSLTWFANVKDLNLSRNDFKILHACIEECHSLRNLNLDGCRKLEGISGIPYHLETFSAKECTSLKVLALTVLPACTGKCHSLRELILDGCAHLEEIRGDLPNLDHLSAKGCVTLTSSCASKFLNKESIEAGNKVFSLPGTKIPDWFKQPIRGESISFWFRGKKFPAISLGLVIGLVNEHPVKVKFSPRVFINHKKQSLANQKVYEFSITTDHIFLFDLRLLEFEDNMDLVFLEDDWNQVEVSYADYITNDVVQIKQVAKYSGIHVIKQTSSMEDMIRLTDPHPSKNYLDFSWRSKFDPRLKAKHRRPMETNVSEGGHGRERFPLLPDQATLQNGNRDPNSMVFDTKRLPLLPDQAILQNGNRDPNPMKGPRQSVTVTTREIRRPRNWNALNIVPSFTQRSLAEVETGQASRQTPSVEGPQEDVGGETSERLPEDGVHLTVIPVNSPAIEEGREGYDVELEAASFGKLENEESPSYSKGSDSSDDLFDQVNKRLSASGKQTKSSAASSGDGDASLAFIREAIHALELLMVKDLSEVSSDPAMQSQLNHLLDLLSTISHPNVTVEVKKAIVEFKRKAFASLQEFRGTVEPVNKLKNFKKQRARIQQETVTGKNRRKGIKHSIRMASLAIKAKNKRRKEQEAEIATLREQLTTKESDLEQLGLNVKSEEATLSNYRGTCDSLDQQARALLKEANDLVAANTGVEDEGEAAEIKQNMLKSTWSTVLTCELIKIKEDILDLGRYE